MNKLFTKIAGLTLGLAMAIGVGVAVGASHKSTVPVGAVGEDITISESTKGASYSGTLFRIGTGGVAASSYYKLGQATFTSVNSYSIDGSKDISYSITTRKFGGPSDDEAVVNLSLKNGSTTVATASYSPTSTSLTAYSGTFTVTGDTSNVKFVIKGNGESDGSKGVGISQITFTAFSASSKTLESVTITGDLDNKEYYVGDDWDYTGLSVQGNYDDETTANLGTVNSLLNADKLIFTATPAKPTKNQQLVISEIAYGDDLIEATSDKEITGITVSDVPVIDGVVLDGDMTNKTYNVGDSWNYAGLYLTVSWTEGKADTTVQLTSLTAGVDFLTDPESATSNSITSILIEGEYEGFEFSGTVSNITVNLVPKVITFTNASSAGTNWKPASSTSYTVDGKTATISVADSTGYSGNGTPVQIGSKANPTTYVNIAVPLPSKSGIVSASATFSSANGATVSLSVYGDSVNDGIFVASVTGNGTPETKTVADDYKTINASTLHFDFECQTGIKLASISYTLGDTVAEFGTFTSLEISSEPATKQFKVGDTFSWTGLKLLAKDNSNPVVSKEYTTGFSVGTSEGDNSFANKTFVSDDAETGAFTVYFTLEINEIIKSVHYDITVTEVPTYTLASMSDLYEGAKVIAVAESVGFGIKSHNGTTCLPSESLTISENVISNPLDAVELTVRIYGERIALQLGSKYLSYQEIGGQQRNQIYLSDSISDDAAWTYNGESLLSNVSKRYLRYSTTISPSGFVAHTDGADTALYLSNKSVKTATLGAQTFAYRYLHMRDYLGNVGEEGSNFCLSTSKGGKGYFDAAATAYVSLSADEKAEFKKLSDAVARINAWAEADGKSIDLDSGTVTNAKANLIGLITKENDNSIVAVIIAISLASVTALGAYFFIKKESKESN